jgi:DNA-binding transcriptional LysR family regulator
VVVSESYRALEEREVDLALTTAIAPVAEDNLEVEFLYPVPLYVLAGTKNPWSRRRTVALRDLLSEPWTLPPADTTIGREFAETFRAIGLDLPPAAVVCSSGLARMALVARGRFLTMASESVLVAAKNMPIKALPIELPKAHTQRPVAIITLKNRTLAPVAHMFIDCVRELAKPLAVSRSAVARSRQVQKL